MDKQSTIQNIFNLCGKTFHVESEIYGYGTKDKNGNYTINHIEIKDAHHASLVLKAQSPNSIPFHCIVIPDELKALADIGKFVRGNDEYYITA